MQVQVMLFGRLMDATGGKQVTVRDVKDTDQLLQQLKSTYPGLVGLPYLIAVDQNIVSANTPLKDGSVVALMPPYSGG